MSHGRTPTMDVWRGKTKVTISVRDFNPLTDQLNDPHEKPAKKSREKPTDKTDG